jgi:FlaA1/EpsC-like NDP-sugar epimerase
LDGSPRSVPLIQWLVLVFMLGGSRLAYRLLRDGRSGVVAVLSDSGERMVPVLLVGTGLGTSLFIRALRNSPEQLFRVAGILEPGQGQTGRHILGVPVIGRLAELESLINRLEAAGERPSRLIVGDRLPPETLDGLIGDANRLGINVCRVPEPLAFEDASERDRLELRPIALEDLLNRPQATLDRSAIGRLIEGRRVLVTGAGGSIGSELVRQIAARCPAELVMVDSCEFNLYSIDHEVGTQHPDLAKRALLADVRQASRIHSILQACRPELVFHAAALKHVPMVELNPCEGVLTNVIGTRNVADAVVACGALAMVLVSTDKAVNPTNVMGASKRLAEFYCQALDVEQAGSTGGGRRTRFMTVRFGNVLGSSGSVVPLFQAQLARGGPLTVTHPEIQRYFMTIPEAVALVLQASAHGIGREEERGRIFVLDMGAPIRVVDVARRLIRLAGLEPGRDVEISFTGPPPGRKALRGAVRRLRAAAPGSGQRCHGRNVAAGRARPAPPDLQLSRGELCYGRRCSGAPGPDRIRAGLLPGTRSAGPAGRNRARGGIGYPWSRLSLSGPPGPEPTCCGTRWPACQCSALGLAMRSTRSGATAIPSWQRTS